MPLRLHGSKPRVLPNGHTFVDGEAEDLVSEAVPAHPAASLQASVAGKSLTARIWLGAGTRATVVSGTTLASSSDAAVVGKVSVSGCRRAADYGARRSRARRRFSWSCRRCSSLIEADVASSLPVAVTGTVARGLAVLALMRLRSRPMATRRHAAKNAIQAHRPTMTAAHSTRKRSHPTRASRCRRWRRRSPPKPARDAPGWLNPSRTVARIHRHGRVDRSGGGRAAAASTVPPTSRHSRWIRSPALCCLRRVRVISVTSVNGAGVVADRPERPPRAFIRPQHEIGRISMD
jgi:hypothetical protein